MWYDQTTIKPQSRPSITVVVGTGRELQAAAHELLHLQIGISGYPKPCLNTIDTEPRVRLLYELNLLEHEIMLPRFLKLGFDPTTFLSIGPSPALPEYLRRFDCSAGVPELEEWSARILDYFSSTDFGKDAVWARFEKFRWTLIPTTELPANAGTESDSDPSV